MYRRLCGKLPRYHRTTEDMDIWIAPTNENKICFFNTLLCMGYEAGEVDNLQKEDFTTYFMLTLGIRPHVIDTITVVHKNISFDDAEKSMIIHQIDNDIEIKIVPYEFLKDMKLRSSRPKDLWDIARLEELRNKKR